MLNLKAVKIYIFSILAFLSALSCSYSLPINDIKITVSKQREIVSVLLEHNYLNKCNISCINSTIIIKFNESIKNITKQGIHFNHNTANQDKLITFAIPNLPLGFKIVSNTQNNSIAKIVFAKSKPKIDIIKENISKTKKFAPIYIENKQDKYTLCIPFFKGKSSVIQNDKQLWIIIDNKDYCENLITPIATKLINNWKHIRCNSANVNRVDISDLKAINVRIDQDKKILQIDLSKNIDSELKNRDVNILEMPDRYQLNIQSEFSCHKFFDTVKKETINVIALEDAPFGLNKVYNSFYCKILPTLQGIAFEDFNQELQISTLDNKIAIRKNANFDSSKYCQSILPWKNKLINLENKLAQLQDEINTTEEQSQKLHKMLTLSKLYFSAELYHESLATLKDVKNYHTKLFVEDINIQFFEAVLHFLCNKENQAKQLLKTIVKKHNKKYIPSEIALWYYYVTNIHNKDDDNLLILNIDNCLKNYHPDVLFKMITDLCGLYIDNNQLGKAKNLLSKIPGNKINNQLDDYLHQKYICYSIKVMLLLEDVYKAENLLNKFCNDYPKITEQFLLPNLLLTQILHKNNKLTTKEAIERLDDCKFLIKDNKSEIELLQFMSELYEQSENYIQSLRTLKYIQDNLSHACNQDLNKNVREMYSRIFIEKDFANTASDFDAVSTFIEFQDLLPIDDTGDEIVLKIINKLVNLDLLPQAIALLEHQINYRVKKNNMYLLNADHLALLYLLNKEPIKAYQILDNTEEYNFSSKEHQKRLIIRAKALLDAKDYENAMKCIKNVESDESFIVHKEILFQSQQWHNYVSLVGPYVLSKLQNEIEQDKYLINDIIKLYISLIKIEDYLSCQHIIHQLSKINKEIAQEVKSLNSNKPSVNIFDKYSVRNQTDILMDQYRKNLFNQN